MHTLNTMNSHEKPGVTVDITLFTIKDKQLHVLLIKRKLEPFKDSWALPGGFVRMNESVEDAAKRELMEETGVSNVYLEQLYTFGEVERDPRGRVITISYMALMNSQHTLLKASTDASEVMWCPIKKIPSLAFDHKNILEYALQRLKWKFEYTTVAFSLLPKKFRVSEVQILYEIIFARKFDKRNFVKKLLSLNILKEEGLNKELAFRPPMMYSLKANVGKIVEIL
jgi:8-oxo-dGTP diphosphatase